jgi:uncharacterized RDD family membrane protein YckC
MRAASAMRAALTFGLEWCVERNVSVRTPESIAFYYELAGLGSRFLAVAVDFVIQSIVALLFVLIAVWATPGAQALAKFLHADQAAFSAVVFAISILALFLWYVGYFVAFETLWNGQTPGKRVIGIRVVRDGGYPVTFMESTIRNLIRVLESLFVYVPSIISALLSSENKRLGDLAAGTIVVRDRAFEVADPAAWMRGDGSGDAGPESVPGLERISDDEFTLIDRYASRSHMLDPRAATETAARIAGALRPKLGPETARYSDHELLIKIAGARRR